MKNRSYKHIVITLLIGFLTYSYGFSQDEFNPKNYRIYFKFKTIKQTDNSRILEVSFIARNKKNRKDRVPVYEADIEFYNINIEDEISLGTAKTDKEGFARLVLPVNQKYILDDEGFINFKAVFEGTDGLSSKEKSLAVKDLFLELDLKEVDSVKTVMLNAFTLDSINSKIPVEEIEIVLSVAGMISNMPIDEGSIEEGEYEFEFPEDIPGDKDGSVSVIASIIDSDEFGDVIQQKNAMWGNINQMDEAEGNKLWTDIAPIWMYVVLTILLVGVWANYVYSIFNLFKIKKEGKELELSAEQEENS